MYGEGAPGTGGGPQGDYSDVPAFYTEGGGGSYPAIALLQLGAGLYDSYQNRKTSKENTNKTIAAQKAESELAYQRSVEQWNRQNMYNSPEAQMQRFLAAGLNPHLIYGQGNPGNASSPPQYQPANLQYRYEAPAYGAALQSVLPLLMSVGTWMQNMRATEASIQKTTTDTDRAKQLIDFLMERNPQLLKEGSNRLSLFPYQLDAQRSASSSAYMDLAALEAEFKHKYGEDLFSDLRHDARCLG